MDGKRLPSLHKGHLLVLIRMKAIRLYHQAGQWYKLPNNDPLSDPLGSSVKMVKTVNVTCLLTCLLTFCQYLGFSFASRDVATALSPPRQSLNDGSLGNAHFLLGGQVLFPFFPFALNFSLAIVLTLKNKSVD